jgi:hypothetical protein
MAPSLTSSLTAVLKSGMTTEAAGIGIETTVATSEELRSAGMLDMTYYSITLALVKLAPNAVLSGPSVLNSNSSSSSYFILPVALLTLSL